MMGGYLLGEAFHDGTLAHAWLTDQDGVVLLAATEDLNHTLYLFFTAYAGVEFALCGSKRQIGTEGIEHRGLRLGLLLRGGSRSRFPALSR